MQHPTSMVKLVGSEPSNPDRGDTYWKRVDEDGIPFRGQSAPMLRDPEAEDRLTEVHDVVNRFFDVMDEEDNRAYLQVLDRIANGWYVLLKREDFGHLHEDGTITKKVYLEWSERFMEDMAEHSGALYGLQYGQQ